jgi:hypothetical protein
MKDDTGKWISPAKLIEILQQLPPSLRIYPNQVGNLAVVAATDAGLSCVGQIDFMHELYEEWGADEEKDNA